MQRMFKNDNNFLRSLHTNPYLLSGSVVASYLIFYTAYDKQKKTLVPGNLLDLIFCRRGVEWTLVETNKAISLSGLTTMMVAFLPQFKGIKMELLWISMTTLWAHSIYSFYKFYNFSVMKVVSEKAVKKTSVVLGVGATTALALGYFNQLSATVMAATTTFLSIAHFYTMEIDFKYVLQVRPFAYLPFPIAGYVFYTLLNRK